MWSVERPDVGKPEEEEEIVLAIARLRRLQFAIAEIHRGMPPPEEPLGPVDDDEALARRRAVLRLERLEQEKAREDAAAEVLGALKQG